VQIWQLRDKAKKTNGLIIHDATQISASALGVISDVGNADIGVDFVYGTEPY
jgi:hypothetical protein